jgi:hypothetical protein
MTVLRITLQKGDGSSLPSPLRVGISYDDNTNNIHHDRKQPLRAVVEPAAEAANVTITVSSKLSSSDVNTTNGVITFKVVGTMESDNPGDQTITAKSEQATLVHSPVQYGERERPEPPGDGHFRKVQVAYAPRTVPMLPVPI